MIRKLVRFDRNLCFIRAAATAVAIAALVWVRWNTNLLEHYSDYFAVPVVALACLGTFARAIWLLVHPERHWMMRDLAVHGPPSQVADAIDAECRAASARCWGTVQRWVVAFDGIATHFTAVTAGWLIHCSHDGFHAVPLTQLAWLYEQVTVQSSFLWATRFHHAVCVGVATGGPVFVLPTRGRVEAGEILAALVQAQPACLTGYRGEWIDAVADPNLLERKLDRRLEMLATMTDRQRADWLDDRLDELEQFPRRIDPNLPDTAR